MIYLEVKTGLIHPAEWKCSNITFKLWIELNTWLVKVRSTSVGFFDKAQK